MKKQQPLIQNTENPVNVQPIYKT